MLTVETALPATALRPFVRMYVQRAARLGADELVEPVVARLGVMLEFEFAGAYEVRNYGSEALDATFPISVIGPQTFRRARLIIRDHVESLVVMFQPAGFYALFGMPTLPLAETGTEGSAVLGVAVSNLRERLGNTTSFAERCRLLDRYFLDRQSVVGAMQPVAQMLQSLTRYGVNRSVDEAARQMGMSCRSLERKALLHAGVTPKQLMRIARFSHAMQMGAATSQTWTRIAHAAGYHDHMHMIRDFRIFAGGAPIAALQEIAPDHLIHFARDGSLRV